MAVSPLMDMGRQGVNAARAGLDLVSRNVANASNPDYSRQEIFFQSPVQGGVRTWTVRSQVDAFIEARLTQENQTQGRLETERRLVGEASAVFGTTDTGVEPAVAQFFAAVSAVASSPDSSVTRSTLLFQADSMVTEFQREAGALRDLAGQVGKELDSAVTQVNQIAANIAKLNQAIGTSDAADGTTGQLRDQRTSLVKQLAGLMNINTFEDGNGNTTVFVAGGTPLVEGTNNYTLTTSAATGYQPYAGIAVITPSGNQVDITRGVTDGQLGGLLRARDQVLQGATADLDRTAGALVLNFNRVHAQGYGLDGSTGNDFFAPLTASATGKGSNTGGVDVAATITDMSAVTLDDYQVVFTSPTQFDIQNVTQGTTVSTGNAYTSGMTVDVAGVRLTLSDGVGAPKTGDSFLVSTTRDQALNITRVLAGADQVAAAQTAAGVPGDNRNALALSALETAKVMDGGTLSVGDKVAQIASSVGLEQQSVEQAYTAQGLVMEGLNARRAEVSSVSLDEEATKLIQFQHAYDASAKLIKVADELLQTIINMV
jgi:flagellar hook-associated protein 1 FlgK